MEWDAHTFRRFLKVFQIKIDQASDFLGIPKKIIEKLLYEGTDFEDYSEQLDAYLQAQKEAKKREHEVMIRYYENFK